MMVDLYAHKFADEPPKDEVEDDDFDMDAELEALEQQAEADQIAADARGDDWETLS